MNREMRTALILFLLLGAGASQAQEACSGGGEEELACWFNRGLDLQKQADAEEEKATLLEQAASAYERALDIDSNRGAVLNNLAGVYDELGRDSEAEDLFERAVLQEDKLQAFYRCNFGDFLAARGDWNRAAGEYRKALEEVPDFFRAHERLTAILAQHSPEALPEYLRFLIDRKQVLWTEEIARARLEEAASEEYLSILVEALAGQSPSPDELLSEPTAQVLRNLIGHPDLGEGAREVLLLRQGDDFDPASYPWWAERGKRQAFRGLIRSFGEAQRRADRSDSARAYFQLAVTLTAEEPDLLAFRRMLDLPSTAGDVDTIKNLDCWNEPQVRKGNPASADRYLYRHDLGLFYAFLQLWEGDRCQPGAIYHLEHAVDHDPATSGGGCPSDARIYTRLMEGDIRTGQPQKARAIWQKLIGALDECGEDGVVEIISTLVLPGPNPPISPIIPGPQDPWDDPILFPDDIIPHDPPKGCCPP